jgi:hypothetical protein
MGMDYRNEEIINFVESIGYTHRVGNYYVITEIDGYINVSYYRKLNDEPEKICFYKNFYSEYRYRHMKDISEIFDNFDEFVRFMIIYHKDRKEVRKLKLKKLETL